MEPACSRHSGSSGRSPTFLEALALIDRVAQFDAPVLIEGETGTGKELAARAIHYGSAAPRGRSCR